MVESPEYEGEKFQRELEKILENFEFRDAQKEMMEHVKNAFETSEHLMVEAGTGIGKSLAYLFPAVKHALFDNTPVIISTATIALQEQLINKEIPLLNKLWQEEIRAAVVKGRSNFLCLDKYYEKYGQDTLEDTPGLMELKEWASETEKGDWQEVEGKIQRELWEEVASSSESCLGHKCLYYTDCYVTKQKREGANAHIVITNHHLFFSDLKLRIDTGSAPGILPEYSCVIFDEAHRLEERALHAFGVQVRKTTVLFWLGETKRMFKGVEDFDNNLVNKLEGQVNKAFDDLGKEFEKSYLLKENSSPRGFSDISRNLIKLSHHVEEFLNRDYLNPDKVEILANNLRKTKEKIDFILSSSSDEYVSWVEVNNKRKNHALNANPLDVSWHLKEYLYKNTQSCIFTSATLAVNDSFDYIKEKLGLNDCNSFIIDSPFNYKEQSAIFVPRDIPFPNEKGYEKILVEGVRTLIELNEGSALILFTSYRVMNYVYKEIEKETQYQVLKQGEMSKKELLEIFQEDLESVLFATDSFREGIDVRGEALTLLIMDKLPFSVPQDPLIQARINHLKQQGIDSFVNYMLPEAVLKLKQGFGRLIRHRHDRGLIAIFDSRIHKKNYGKIFINSLPSTRFYRNWDKIHQIFD